VDLGAQEGGIPRDITGVEVETDLYSAAGSGDVKERWRALRSASMVRSMEEGGVPAGADRRKPMKRGEIELGDCCD